MEKGENGCSNKNCVLSFSCSQLAHKFCTFFQKLFGMNVESLTHESVLLDEVLALLVTDATVSVFDGTLGLGGHAEAILKKFPNVTRYIACDLDAQHLAFAKKRLGEWGSRIDLHHGAFEQLGEWLGDVPRPLVMLLDLGLCSNQLDDASKGFAFAADGPLTMAFDDSRVGAAAELLATATERELMTIFREYGEEPLAHKIAKKIVAARDEQSIETTAQLREIVESAVHVTARKKTLVRVFQSIRIAVNDEIEMLQKTLDTACALMRSGDRIGVISYHSLEDRLVKKQFAAMSRPRTAETDRSLHEVVEEAKFCLLTKKAVQPTAAEIERNPRSRSAKFRILEKI